MFEIPMLIGNAPDTGVTALLSWAGTRYGWQFTQFSGIVFQAVIPSTYIGGRSLDVRMYMEGTGPWNMGVSFQKLETGASLTTFSYSTERTVSGSGFPLLVNLPVGDFVGLQPNTMFRMKVRLLNIPTLARLIALTVANGS